MRFYATCLLALLLLSAPASAFFFIPPIQTNWTKIVQKMEENYARIEEQRERVSQMKDQMEQAGINTELKVDGNNNAITNATVRLNQQKTDVHNLNLAKETVPALFACDAVATSESLEEILCAQEDKRMQASSSMDRQSLASSPGLTGLSARDVALQQAPDPDEEELISAQDLLEPISALMGHPASHPQELSDSVTSAVAIAFPLHAGSHLREEWNSEQSLNEMQRIARKNLPQKVAYGIAARRAEVDGVSEAGALDVFARNHHSGKRTENLTTNNVLPQASINRERFLSKAARVWRSVNEYEMALEQEFVLAVRLAEAVSASAPD